jgi:hypothetical protein
MTGKNEELGCVGCMPTELLFQAARHQFLSFSSLFSTLSSQAEVGLKEIKVHLKRITITFWMTRAKSMPPTGLVRYAVLHETRTSFQ